MSKNMSYYLSQCFLWKFKTDTKINSYFVEYLTNLVCQAHEPQLVRIQIFINIGYLENQWSWFWTHSLTWHPNMAQTFLLLDAITDEKTVKLIQLDTMPALLSRISHLQVPIILMIIRYLVHILWGKDHCCYTHCTDAIERLYIYMKIRYNCAYIFISRHIKHQHRHSCYLL